MKKISWILEQPNQMDNPKYDNTNTQNTYVSLNHKPSTPITTMNEDQPISGSNLTIQFQQHYSLPWMKLNHIVGVVRSKFHPNNNKSNITEQYTAKLHTLAFYSFVHNVSAREKMDVHAPPHHHSFMLPSLFIAIWTKYRIYRSLFQQQHWPGSHGS